MKRLSCLPLSRLIVGLLPCFLLSCPGTHAATSNLLGGGPWVLLSPPKTAQLSVPPAGKAQILHVTVLKPSNPYYQTQLTHDITSSVAAGTRLRLQFWARSANQSTFHAVLEKRTAPYTHLMDQQITLTPVWKEYAFAASVPAAYGSHGMAARLQIGQKAGSFEFKNITVITVSR